MAVVLGTQQYTSECLKHVRVTSRVLQVTRSLVGGARLWDLGRCK